MFGKTQRPCFRSEPKLRERFDATHGRSSLVTLKLSSSLVWTPFQTVNRSRR